jgi:hypothetical protein
MDTPNYLFMRILSNGLMVKIIGTCLLYTGRIHLPVVIIPGAEAETATEEEPGTTLNILSLRGQCR